MGDMLHSSDASHGHGLATRLFSILEIFEQIMIDIDQRTLLTVASRVCRLWRDSVNRSWLLRRHLFFEPDLVETDVTTRVFNPLLLDIFPDWFPSSPASSERWTLTLEEIQTRLSAHEKRPFAREEIQKWLPRLWGRKRKAMVYEHASWRRMLPCQPPLYSLIRCTIRRGQHPRVHLMTLTQPDPDDIVYEEVPARDWTQLREYTPEEVVPELPITMVRLYNLVERGGNSGEGQEEEWLFEWSSGFRLHPKLAAYVHGDLKVLLTDAIQRDGLVFVEWTDPDRPIEWEYEPVDEFDDPLRTRDFQKAGMRLEYEVDDRLDHRRYVVHEVWGRRLRAWHLGYWTCSSEDEDGPQLGSRIQGPVHN